jgi:hypothetical protein
MGQLALSRGLASMGICYDGQGADIISKGFFHTINTCPKHFYNMYLCVLDKKRFSCAG